MSCPQISGPARTVTATNVLRLAGDALDGVARGQGLTNTDVGRVIGRKDDSAGRYRTAQSEMGIVAFALATAEWGADFADPLLNELGYRLCPIDADAAQPSVTAAGVGTFLAQLLTFMADGKLIHAEKLALADTLRPLMPQLQALLVEAAEIRS